MRGKRFTGQQIALALRQAKTRVSVLKEKTRKPKQLVAELSLDKIMLPDVIRKKL